DRLRRGNGGAASPEDGDVEGVEARLLEAELGGDLASGVDLRDTRRKQEPGRREVSPVLLVAGHDPVLLAGGVEVVDAGRQAGLDHLRAVPRKGAHHVADDGRAAEERGERLYGVLGR